MLFSSRAALTAATLSFVVLGCTDANPASKPGGEAHGSEPHGTHGGDHDPCGDTPRTDAVAWAASTELGTSARDAFSAAAGTCSAPFTWDGSGLYGRTVEPRKLDGEMTVTVTIDETSARLVRPPEGKPPGLCPSFLEVEASVGLKSADGVIEETAKSTLHYETYAGLLPFGFNVPLGTAKGRLSVELGKHEQGILRYTLDGAGESCAGNIGITLTTIHQGGHGTGHIGLAGSLGQWSRSGCPLGEQHVDLTTPRGDRPSLADELVELWGDASYAGTWEDGKKTTLRVQLAVAATSTCGTQGELNVPVEVTYGTADGRIVEHATQANVHTGSDLQLGLWISDEMRCKDMRATLDYPRARCAEVDSVTLQLGLTSDDGRTVDTAGARVDVYGTPRVGDEAPDLGNLTLTGAK